MKKLGMFFALLVIAMPAIAANPAAKGAIPQAAPIPAGENDKTLQAMRDELERSRTRLQLPGVEKPFPVTGYPVWLSGMSFRPRH